MATTPLSNYGHRFKNWLDDFEGKVKNGEEHWSSAKQTGETIVQLGKEVHVHSKRLEDQVDHLWDCVHSLNQAKDQIHRIMTGVFFGVVGGITLNAILNAYCPYFQ